MPSVDEKELLEMRENEKAERAKSQADINDLTIKYKTVFGSEDGKDVLKDLSKICGMNRTSYGSKNEPYDTIFLEGMRNVFIYIRDQVEKVIK